VDSRLGRTREKDRAKKASLRDERRYLDVKKEINYRINDLLDRDWTPYGQKEIGGSREEHR
jgi:hypothetical protein